MQREELTTLSLLAAKCDTVQGRSKSIGCKITHLNDIRALDGGRITFSPKAEQRFSDVCCVIALILSHSCRINVTERIQ